MKILFINASDTIIPPPEDMIRASLVISSMIAEQLQKKGHDIYFICPIGSQVKTKKIFTSTKPLVGIISKEEYNQIPNADRSELLSPFYFDLYYKLIESINSQKFDLVHFHLDLPLAELAVASKINIPSVFTLHTASKHTAIETEVIKLFNVSKNYFISISNYQRKTFPAISFFQTVYHGLPLQDYAFEPVGKENLLFTGRLKKSKGIIEGLNIALKTSHKLLITGKFSYEDEELYNNQILPTIKAHPDLIHYLSFKNRLLMNSFYKQGKLLLFPIQWEEPFGLVMIEAMATGTPVVAFAKGSVPEVIKDGETGFIVNPSNEDIRGDWIIKKTGIEGLCEAVEKVYAMPENEYRTMRINCRQHVEKNFTIERMVDEYEKVYQKILDRRPQFFV